MFDRLFNDSPSDDGREHGRDPGHHDPDPQQYAEVYPTLSGDARLVDPDNPTRWIQSDTLQEVRR